MSRHFLVADIGGTNARFALGHLESGTIHMATPSVRLTADHASLDAALAHFLEEKSAPPLDAVAVCAAGPVAGGEGDSSITMTNCPWEVSQSRLARATGVAVPLLMNDFAALALAVPHLGASDLYAIGGGKPDPAAAIAIIGPGTGLGVGALVPAADGRYIALPGEGGHVDLTATTPRELALAAQLMKTFGRVSVERVLSGPGLVALYVALTEMEDRAPEVRLGAHVARLAAQDIATLARTQADPLAVEAVQLFCGWLGATAGNLALTFGGRGGVYIGGGIVPGWLGDDAGAAIKLFDAPLVRQRFDDKGRLGAWLKQVPLHVITRPNPALLGLAHAALARLEP